MLISETLIYLNHNQVGTFMMGPIVGLDVAGVVSEVAEDSTSPFKVGDKVFGTCRGSLADRVCVSSAKLGHKAKCASYVQAAAMPTTYLTSLQALRGLILKICVQLGTIIIYAVIYQRSAYTQQTTASCLGADAF